MSYCSEPYCRRWIVFVILFHAFSRPPLESQPAGRCRRRMASDVACRAPQAPQGRSETQRAKTARLPPRASRRGHPSGAPLSPGSASPQCSAPLAQQGRGRSWPSGPSASGLDSTLPKSSKKKKDKAGPPPEPEFPNSTTPSYSQNLLLRLKAEESQRHPGLWKDPL